MMHPALTTHFSMFRDLSYLKPYRLKILRLYSRILNLECMAIWDDLARPLRFPDSNAAGPSTSQQAASASQA